jgi:hypothetical protein
MTTIAPATKSFQTAAQDSAEHIWLLTIAFSIFQYALSTDIAGRNAEALAAFARALGGENAGDKPARSSESPAESFDILSVEEGLAGDKRSVGCKALGSAMDGVTMPGRKELILASSVIC